jgi:hypothetical protein
VHATPIFKTTKGIRTLTFEREHNWRSLSKALTCYELRLIYYFMKDFAKCCQHQQSSKNYWRISLLMHVSKIKKSIYLVWIWPNKGTLRTKATSFLKLLKVFTWNLLLVTIQESNCSTWFFNDKEINQNTNKKSCFY